METEMEMQMSTTPENVKDSIVSICGWCPGARELTLALVKEGFKRVSHGMCSTCQVRMEAQIVEGR